MAQTPPDKATLFEWLDSTIDSLPNKGQITLNFDGNTVAWEVKSSYVTTGRNGEHERTEMRRFGWLQIRRPLRGQAREVGIATRIMP